MKQRLETIYKNIEELQDIATLFYHGRNLEGFEKMEDGTKKILTMVEETVQLTSMDSSKNGLDLNFVNAALTEILSSYERKDGIMIADLLTFELLDHVNSIVGQWKE